MRICPDCATVVGDEVRFCHVDGAQTLASDGNPLIGMEVGPYRLVRMLGEGGMGQVYLGVHPSIGSRVAVKLLDGSAAARKDLVDRFFAEAMAVNRIRHENIVNVLDLDNLTLADGQSRPYIIMEHLEGRPLSSVLAHFGTLPQGTLIGVMREILGALHAAHGAGIIHRDLKPDNVFISPQGRTKVLDFGIAKLLPNALSGGEEVARFTQTGMLLGTPSYMSPEQVRGAQVTPAADLYAAGVILYEASTGHLPFGGETLYELLDKHINAAPTPPRQLNPRVHPALEAVILRALAKDPAHRFASAAQMSDALMAAAGSLPAEAWASISLTGSEPALVADPTPRPTPSGQGAPAPQLMAHTPAQAPAPRPRRPPFAMLAPLIVIVIAAITVGVFFVVKSIGDTEVGGTETAANTATAAADAAATPDTDDTAAAPPTDPNATAEATDAETARAGGPTRSKTSSTPPANPGKKSPPTTTTPAPTPTTTPASNPPADAPNNATDDDGLRPFKGGGGVVVINTAEKAAKETGLKRFSQAAGVSTTSFDGVAYLPTAQKLARKLMPDAILTHFEVDGVGPSGRANLNIGSHEATYRFRSPARSKRPANVPVNMEIDIPCMVYVDVRKGKVSVYPTTDEKCKDKKRPRPRCSLAAVWKKAYALGAPKGNWIANIDYLWDGWYFDIPGGEGDSDFTESIKDDC